MIDDGDLAAVLAELGLPGLIDVHVHAMPDRVLAAVWGAFDRAEEFYGRAWPIRYRDSDEQRRATLASLGVRRYTTLNYAHRPDMAAGLNAWSTQYAQAHAPVIHSGTFYPEPTAPQYVAEALQSGARVFKVHVEVGAFELNDPLLEPVWGMVEDAGSTIVAHVGSAPLPSPFTGPAPVADLLRRFPRLRLVIAHMGFPETADFFDLAGRYESVAFDTTMVGTDFMNEQWTLGRELFPRLRELGLAGRILLGTDFPNIPYPYAHQIEALQRLDFGADWMREVLWAAGERRFGPVALD